MPAHVASDPAQIPVIVGVGEIANRPSSLAAALDPVGLMVAALERAAADAGDPALLSRLDRLEVINEVSWPYFDIEAELRDRMLMPGLSTKYWPVGGQTPITALHEAALAIQRGEAEMVAVCGGEAQSSVRQAMKSGEAPPWPDRDPDFRPLRGGDYQGEAARRLELTSPVNVYPLYENASRAAWGQSFAEAQRESAAIWSRNSQVATQRPAAWIEDGVSPEAILSDANGNRLIAWPYRKLMVANPFVNQGAAFILASLANAREWGIAEDRLVFVLGGAAADEPRDIMERADFTRSRAMEGVLDAALALTGGDGADGEADCPVELYSCFPCVPKMARRVLGLGADRPLTVTGGLTFFGAPLNDFMSHAVVAMVERLRSQGGGTGLLYGQGEYVTKHHALALGTQPPETQLDDDYRLAALECELAGAAPALDQDYRGEAILETYTVLFDRESEPRHGVAIARNAQGARVAARVDAEDRTTIARLLSEENEPVGAAGQVLDGPDGSARWRFA